MLRHRADVTTPVRPCMMPAARPQTELIHMVVSVALFLDLLVTLLTTLDYLGLDTLDWLP